MRHSSLSLLLIPFAVVASPLPDFPFVSVQGTARREIAPDKVTITFHIVSFDSSAEEAYRRQGDVADKVITFCEKLGIPTGAIVAQAIDKSATRREDEKGKEFEILGYKTDRNVKIELSDLLEYQKLAEFLYAQSNVEDIVAEFGRKDEVALRQSLTDDACKMAMEDAERLSKGFHKKIKVVRAISGRGFADLGSPFGLSEDVGSYKAGSHQKNRDFEAIPSTITLQQRVYAIFEIE
jgi:uncharacterized protein